jgi:hypothetical protein
LFSFEKLPTINRLHHFILLAIYCAIFDHTFYKFPSLLNQHGTPDYATLKSQKPAPAAKPLEINFVDISLALEDLTWFIHL